MDYRKEYESYLLEKQQLREAGGDTTLFIKKFTERIEALPKTQRSAFMKTIIQIETERTNKSKKELEAILNIELPKP